jgi:hypothetical protein
MSVPLAMIVPITAIPTAEPKLRNVWMIPDACRAAGFG